MKRHVATLGPFLLVGVSCTSGTIEGAPDGGGSGDEPAGSHDGGSASSDDDCPLPEAPPSKQAFFTHDRPDGDPTIEDQLVGLIEAAVPGSRIHGAFAYLDQTRVADAFLEAAGRGVDVYLIVDERNQVEREEGWEWNSAVARLRDGLGDRLIVCGGGDLPADQQGGCIGHAKQHSAFLLLSSTCDGADLIVAQTSAYPTKGQLGQRNNLVVIRGDRGLFEAYGGYWVDLSRQRRDDSYYQILDGDSGTRLFLYPRAPEADQGEPAATDTIHRLLRDHVDCAAGASIEIAMAYWTSSRPALIDELVRLEKSGCGIDLVVDPAKVADDVKAILTDHFAPDHLRFVPGVHHKFIIIDGSYAGTERRLVWTGTQDFTLSALRDNDETILRIEDDGIHGDFAAAFAELFRDGTVTPESPPP
jgi:phosphatidylserine/phosphatidylglycerophosphate/cardiolipin synthase-like enzyme